VKIKAGENRMAETEGRRKKGKEEKKQEEKKKKKEEKNKKKLKGKGMMEVKKVAEKWKIWDEEEKAKKLVLE